MKPCIRLYLGIMSVIVLIFSGWAAPAFASPDYQEMSEQITTHCHVFWNSSIQSSRSPEERATYAQLSEGCKAMQEYLFSIQIMFSLLHSIEKPDSRLEVYPMIQAYLQFVSSKITRTLYQVAHSINYSDDELFLETVRDYHGFLLGVRAQFDSSKVHLGQQFQAAY